MLQIVMAFRLQSLQSREPAVDARKIKLSHGIRYGRVGYAHIRCHAYTQGTTFNNG